MTRLVAVLAALLVALAIVPLAAAKIVIQKGMAGVSLGMTRAQIVARLGRPSRTRTGRNDLGRYVQLVYFGAGVEITFQSGGKATAIATALGYERTASGVGVGSTEKQVRAKVPGLHCQTPPESARHCFIGNFRPGTRVTDFVFRRGGIVTRVTVGVVFD